MSSKIELTADEIVALLRKSSLPTLLVEGSDDMIVFRKFEQRLADIGVDVLPVGGRQMVLEIFNRKSELPAASKVVFVADKDIWVYTGIPGQYVNPRLVLTFGYSIENDTFVDGTMLDLMDGTERIAFDSELASFVHWYALVVSRHLVNPSVSIKNHPNHVLDPAHYSGLTGLLPGEQYPEELRQMIHEDFQTLLRGKSLMALLVRRTNYPGRAAKHDSRCLLEWTAIRPGPKLLAILKKVRDAFSLLGVSTVAG